MDQSAAVDVVPAIEDDWETVRRVRLAALADSPGAFRSTTEREAAFDDERWREWSRSGRVFLATAEGRVVGMAAGALDDDRADVVSMWVEPALRGGPAASRLLLAVAGWAQQTGAQEVGLAVMADNHRARAFYERHGFVHVTTRTSRKDPSRDVDRMVLAFRR